MRIFWSDSYTKKTNLARKKNTSFHRMKHDKSKSKKITVRIKMLITATPLTLTGMTTTMTTINSFILV